jgi:hypothetical protein
MLTQSGEANGPHIPIKFVLMDHKRSADHESNELERRLQANFP